MQEIKDTKLNFKYNPVSFTSIMIQQILTPILEDCLYVDFLKDPNIPVEEAKNLYRFRRRSAKFKENMKYQYQSISCPFCLVYSDTQNHSMYRRENKITVKGNHEDIFQGNNTKRSI